MQIVDLICPLREDTKRIFVEGGHKQTPDSRHVWFQRAKVLVEKILGFFVNDQLWQSRPAATRSGPFGRRFSPKRRIELVVELVKPRYDIYHVNVGRGVNGSKTVLVREFTCSSGRHGFEEQRNISVEKTQQTIEISAESGTVDFAYVEICAVMQALNLKL